MKQPKKVLACVDQSPYADYVADYSACAAQRFSLPLELLHTIDRHQEMATSDDHSGAIGFDAQENLLNRLTEEEGERSRAIREQGRLFLNELKKRCEQREGIAVDVRQRYGQLLETLDEQQQDVALYVLGRRGKSATQTEHAQHERIAQTLAASKGSILHTAQSAHQLHHASADRTLRTLQDGDAKVVSPEGVVHVGKSIVKRDVLYNEVCTCCAKYKQTAPAVRAGIPARRDASGDACPARE